MEGSPLRFDQTSVRQRISRHTNLRFWTKVSPAKYFRSFELTKLDTSGSFVGPKRVEEYRTIAMDKFANRPSVLLAILACDSLGECFLNCCFTFYYRAYASDETNCVYSSPARTYGKKNVGKMRKTTARGLDSCIASISRHRVSSRLPLIVRGSIDRSSSSLHPCRSRASIASAVAARVADIRL
jgi:hypothetical protein